MNMASIITSSDDEYDEQSDRFDDSYSHSADISESESSSTNTFTCDHPNAAAADDDSTSPLDFASTSSDLSVLPPPVMLPVVGGRHVIISENDTEKDEVDFMKERFAKLLLGEDMSGGGNGVCTSLAISNAITNLAATVFGDLWKLEPLAPQKKLTWSREMDWLLSVSDSIVELIPSVQEFPGGETFEIMVTQQRSDLYVNLPALKKIDAMLITLLDGFSDSEFSYIDRGVVFSEGEHIQADSCSSSSSGRPSIRVEEKWWLPFPKVPENGLSEATRTRLQQCRECTNQIFKAALAINTNVLSEMEVPKDYLESLPKSGRACLGEILYRYISAEQFSPESLLDYLELSSEFTTLEIANRIEDAVLIWKQKCQKKRFKHSNSRKTSWGGAVKGLVGDMEKSKVLAERAETLLRCLKLHFPGLPQTTLDMNKIQYNKDVGQSILESYSRVMESLAYNLMARIDDLLYVDDATKLRAAAKSISEPPRNTLQKQSSAPALSIRTNFRTSSVLINRRCKSIALV